MGLRIKTNVASLSAQRSLADSTKSLNDTSGKLSSGKRINKAADDAAGLAISETMRADVRSLNVAKRSANDAISMVQTAEGALNETSNMLVRLRELAIQGASDTIGDKERAYIDLEYVALKDEIDRIANSTEFNGIHLLAGKGDELPGQLQEKGTHHTPLEVQVSKDYFSGADSLEENNPVNIIRIDLSDMNAHTHGENSLGIGKSEDGTSVKTKVDSQNSISTLDGAITKISEFRAYLGSIQNRFSSSINNLGVQVENLTVAKSRIADTDFAAATAEYTSEKILQQSGTSVLSQANQSNSIALSLINGM